MKVKIVRCRESAPEHKCGVHTVVDRQAQGLVVRGHEIYDVYPRYPGTKTTDKVFRTHPLVLGKHRFSWPPWVDLIGQWRLRRWLLEINPDTVHCNGTQQTTDHMIKATRWCEKTLRKMIQLILQIHTDEERYSRIYLWWLPRFVLNWILRIQAKRSRRFAESVDRVIAPTKNFADRFRRFTGYDGPIEILPSQAEIFEPMTDKVRREFEVNFRHHHHLPVSGQQRPLISVIGRVSPVKNLEMTIVVFARIIEILKNEPAQDFLLPCLLFVGEEDSGKYRLKLQKRVRELGLKNIVRFTGFLPYQETAHVHQISAVEIRISQTESNDMVLVEAMAYGAVPVVIKGTAQDEILANPELTCRSDIDEIARLIIKILDNAEFKTEMIECNRKRSLLYQDSQAYMQTLLGLYDLPL